jgi:hypothetical protein
MLAHALHERYFSSIIGISKQSAQGPDATTAVFLFGWDDEVVAHYLSSQQE